MAKPATKNIDGHVYNDHLQILRTNPNTVPAGEAVSKAWLTVKTAIGDPDPGVLQKVITLVPTADGEILDDGSATGTFDCRFEVPRADQASMTPGTTYEYDVQVELSPSGELHTFWRGTLRFAAEVTEAVA